jgi:polysaccharide biosynthesis/export protein
MKYIIALMVMCFGYLSAQENIPLLDLQNQKYNSSLEKMYQNRSVIRTTAAQVLESELDENVYIVGPGDQFKVSVFGELENQFEFSVLPEGMVLIPTIGQIHVGKLSLKDAKKKIFDSVKANYIRADISVNLTGLRKFRVYYTGEVKAPGTYFAQGSDRLSDVVEISVVEDATSKSSLSDWANDTQILITHKSGKKETFDLTKFYREGDKSQNPHLESGDIIYVPSIDLSGNYVIIEGNVGFQGVYSIKQDEKLFDFLRRVSALNKKSNLEQIIIERNGNREIIDILNDHEQYLNYRLVSQDKIIIPTIYDKVYVRGEVLAPGAYPYLANYTAKDYIGRAGALDSADDIEDVVILRQATQEILTGIDVIIEKGDTIILPKRAREIFKDYMTILTPLVSIALSTIVLFQTSK